MGTVSVVLLCGVVGPALAQTTAPVDDKKADGKTVGDTASDKKKTDTTTVTITGKKQDRADRQVYDVTKNPDANTGTAADALNKIPGVTVDPSGNVTLHGRNVVIYLNGRPSLMLSGDNRGIALQSMPSAYISTIEVITNPGAQYSSGKADSIININTKRNMPPGYVGSIGGRAGSIGGGSAYAFLNVTKGRLSLTLTASGTETPYRSRFNSVNTSSDGAGAVTQSSVSDGQSRGTYKGPFVTANLQYDIDTSNVLAGALHYNRGTSDYTGLSHTISSGPGGALTNVFDASTPGTYIGDNSSLTLAYTHYGKKPDETLKIDGSLERQSTRNAFLSDNTYSFSDMPANTGTRTETYDHNGQTHKAALHAEYNTPVGDDQLTLGGEVDADDKQAGSQAFGPGAQDSDLPLNPLLTDDFHSHQVVSALYGTYQREITPNWTVLAGLRGERTTLSTDDLTYGTRGKVTYVRLNPSIFATYVLSPKQKLRFSYSRRQSLPDASDLNPHIVYSSDASVNAGNPNLKPQETDAFEARYEYDGKTLNYAFRGFYHRDDGTIVPTSQVIPDPQNAGNFVTETTHVNWRHQTADGVTATVSKQIASKLTLNADATVTFDAIRNPLITGVQSGTSVDGSVSLNYFLFKGDQIYLQYKVIGKRFTGQGYTTGYAQGNIQYSHKLSSKLSLTVTIQDPFRQGKMQTVIDTPLLHSRFVNSQQAPTFMIGFTRQFTHFGPMPAVAH